MKKRQNHGILEEMLKQSGLSDISSEATSIISKINKISDEENSIKKSKVDNDDITPANIKNDEKIPHSSTKIIQNIVSKKVAKEESEYKLDKESNIAEYSDWKIANMLFPKQNFPWQVLPEEIADSLQQLARSCATSPTAIPGAAIAIFASALGSTIDVSPKKSWNEPLIFWFGDIRPSGCGKTPAARELCQILYDYQKEADDEYKKKLNEWQNSTAKKKGKAPERARGYFVTDLTLEGLRLEIKEHGGIVCVMDELSSFLSSQNQYKQKGNDRECWLNLWDGKPARVVRTKESYTIYGARINLFGGIQPRIWQDFFGAGRGLFLEDGTIYRFLPIYENDSFFPLNNEEWSDQNRYIWEKLLTNALEWANLIILEKKRKTINLILSKEAQKKFFDWRNDLFAKKNSLPVQVRGFLPKIVSYALRSSGIIYSMNKFIKNSHPDEILSIEDINKGINVAEFYMGHAVNAVKMLCLGQTLNTFEITEQTKRLSNVLFSLKKDLDCGRLAIGFICDKYNTDIPPEEKLSPRTMGAMLRNINLTIPTTRHRANGKVGAFCLLWDKKTDEFINKCMS